MKDFCLFSHWTFQSFAPGVIPRVKYNAFREIHQQSGRCFELLAQFEAFQNAPRPVDWCRVSGLVKQLTTRIHQLVDQLQIMNPVEFMDAHDWFAKLRFYALLAVEHVAVSTEPPYLLPFFPAHSRHDYSWVCTFLNTEDTVSALVVAPSLAQYFVETGDLRPALDAILGDQNSNLDMKAALRTQSSQAQKIIQSGALPPRLCLDLEIAAAELAPSGGLLDAWFFLGQDEEALLIGEKRAIAPRDIIRTWQEGLAHKYTPATLDLRRNAALADEESPFSMVILPAGTATTRTPGRPKSKANSTALQQRLKQARPQVNTLHVFQCAGVPLHPKHCRSLHDFVCLCLEQGLAQIFAFAGSPTRGLAGIKRLRLEIPVVANIFNLESGLFPSAAEKSTITVEDIRCIPAWSLLLGLTTPLVRWPGTLCEEHISKPHYSSYAVLSQFFMHCTLRLEKNLYIIECSCDENTEKYIYFRCKTENHSSVTIIKQILQDEGFEIYAHGDYLDANRSGVPDVFLQRNLACLGLLIAWMQTAGSLELAQGEGAFQTLLNKALANPR